MVKTTKILVNRYNGKYGNSELIFEIKKEIKSAYDLNKWNEMIDEANIVNDMYHDFYNTYTYIEAE